MFLEDEIVIELKAVKTLEDVQFAQCQNCIKATGKKLGLVVSFGEEKVKNRRAEIAYKGNNGRDENPSKSLAITKAKN
jgi:GxxExxY protein